MKVEYPKWIYHPTEEARIIQKGPIPEGWYRHGDLPVEEVSVPKKTRNKRTPKVK